MLTHDSFVVEFPTVAPRIVWALAADTNRASRAMGLVAGVFHAENDAEGRPIQVGVGKQMGLLPVAWVTGPDSWIEGAWYRTIRRYRAGPADEGVIDYRIEPFGEGCRVTVARRTTGNPVAVAFDRLVVGGRLRRYIAEAVAVAARCPNDPACGEPAAFAMARALPEVTGGPAKGGSHPNNEEELALRRNSLREAPVNQAVLDDLARFLTAQADEEVAALSPGRFAERSQVPMREILRAFLFATRAGLLELHWSLRCQTCRVSAATVDSLEALPESAKCLGCGGVFGSDLATHVEATFSVHPAIRKATVQKYCTAGASSRPHVFAQLTATPEAPCAVEAPLFDGGLDVRVLGLPGLFPLPVSRPGSLAITVRADGFSVEPVGADAATTKVSIRCEGKTGQAVVLLERREWHEDWVSAATLATIPEFHQLFGGEAPRSKQEISVGTLAMIFSDLRGSTAMYQKVGDARAFTLVADHFERLTRAIEANEGVLIKTMGDAVMAVFQTTPAAVRAALAMNQAIATSETGAVGLTLKLGVHVGNCLAVRANGRLDFFGHHVNLAARTQGQSRGGDIVLTEAVATHPGVSELLRGLDCEIFEATLKGIDRPQRLWRVTPGV